MCSAQPFRKAERRGRVIPGACRHITITEELSMKPIPTLMLTAALAAIVGCGDDAVASKSSTPAQPSTDAAGKRSDGTTPATTTPTDPNSISTPADNTKRNRRDDGTTATPLDQGTSETDIAITQAVRKAVTAEPDLSVNARNVKIITRDAAVTLRGPVNNGSERERIGALAQRVAGVRSVDNQLEIAH
jgi:hypothetical protein